MTERETLNALACEAPDLEDEAEHFMTCVTCQQVFDLRNLGDVLHHDLEMHDPLPVN